MALGSDPGARGYGASTPGMPRFLVVILGIVGCLLALILLKEFSGIIGPVLFALNLMITAYPLHTWLVRKGTPSWLSSVVVSLSVFAILIAMVSGFVWSINKMIAILPNYSDGFDKLYDQAKAQFASLGIEQTSALNNLWKTIDPSSVLNAAGSVVSGASGFLGVLTIIVTALVFITMDNSGIAARMEMLGESRSNIARAMTSFAQGVRRYWVVTTVFGVIVAVFDGIALAIIGVPLALVWALFSFLTNYIPNIGFVIGLLPPALIALISQGWQSAVAVVVIYSVLNFVIQSIIQPRFTGESVGVTPSVSFISLLVWTTVLGAMGSLLALPMTLLAKAFLVDADPRTRWVNALISSDPDSALADHD